MEPSEKVPVAVYCCVPPAVMVALVGAMVIEVRAAGMTARVAESLRAVVGSVAVMVTVPSATPVARPLGAILAIEVSELAHVNVAVTP